MYIGRIQLESGFSIESMGTSFKVVSSLKQQSKQSNLSPTDLYGGMQHEVAWASMVVQRVEVGLRDFRQRHWWNEASTHEKGRAYRHDGLKADTLKTHRWKL